MTTERLERAFATSTKVLAGVQTDQLGLRTPCASWTVADLMNHMIGAPASMAARLSTSGGPDPDPDANPAAGDFNAAFAEAKAACVAAFNEDGATERVVKMPFGEIPASVLLAMATTDTFTHAWDLAMATGQPADLDPELAAELLGFARGVVTDALRGPDGKAPFGPEVTPREGATAAEQLAAFVGRDAAPFAG